MLSCQWLSHVGPFKTVPHCTMYHPAALSRGVSQCLIMNCSAGKTQEDR